MRIKLLIILSLLVLLGASTQNYERRINEMPIISGLNNKDGRLVIINEADWSVEYNQVRSAAPDDGYTATVSGGEKLVVFRKTDGEVEAFGKVTPGADPGDGLTDSSSNDHTMSATAGISFSTDSVFGNSSLSLGGSDNVYTPTHSSLHLGTVFTISFRIKAVDTVSSIQRIISFYEYAETEGGEKPGGYNVGLGSDGKLYASYYSDGTDGHDNAYYTGAGSVLSDTGWHHIAFVRNGITFYLFLDGTSVGTSIASNPSATETMGTIVTNNLCIGKTATSDSRYFKGKIDEVELINGTALWTSNFTPPTSASSSTANHELLMHMDDPDAS